LAYNNQLHISVQRCTTETLAIIVSLMQKELVAMQTPSLGEAELKATHRNIEVHHGTTTHGTHDTQNAHDTYAFAG
jgi:hypothetical protein